MNIPMRLLACVLGITATAVSAAPLREGEFTRVINDVRILSPGSSPVSAKTGARIQSSNSVATGAQSRAEIRFPDNTLTRVGANSVFRMDLSSRTVDMDKGVILLQVPKQLGGAKVRTAAVTAAITGTTILLEFSPDGFIKIIVIEGEVDVSLNERRNQFRTLAAGDMWISKANDKTGLPMPVQVDLDRLKKTSKLFDEKEFGPLGNQKQMATALKEQKNKKDKGDLVDTVFQIQGRGRNVSFLLGDRQHIGFVGVQPPVAPPPVDPPPVKPPVDPPPVKPPVKPPVDPPPVKPPVDPPPVNPPPVDPPPVDPPPVDPPPVDPPPVDPPPVDPPPVDPPPVDPPPVDPPPVDPPPVDPPPVDPPPVDPPPVEPPPVDPPPEDPPPVDPPPVNKPVNIAGSTIFDNQSIINTSSPSFAYNSPPGGFMSLPGSGYAPAQDGPFGVYMYDDALAFTGLDTLLSEKDAWSVLKFDELYISGNPSVETTAGSVNLIIGATGDINFRAVPPFAASRLDTGDLWTFDSSIAAVVFPSLSGSINFDGFHLAGTGQSVVFNADGPASDVDIKGVPDASIRLPEGSLDAAAGRDVNVSRASVEAKTIKTSAGRDVKLSKAKLAASDSMHIKARRGVQITNSTQLRQLSQLDNPEILIEALAGNVEMAGRSSVEADVVSINSQKGDVKLMNSAVAAREIKARVFDAGGILLISNSVLGRGTDPSDLIRLYGEGSGGVRFVGDTTLRGNTVQIAGSNVTIDRGSRVRLSNPGGTTVYADSHRYNNGINGNFTGLGKGQSKPGPVKVNQESFGNRPGF